MRPGLVGLGAILLALAAVTVGVLFLGSGPPTTTSTATLEPVPIAAHAQADVALSGSNTTDGTANLVWASNVPLTVQLYNPSHCPLSNETCVDSTLVMSWAHSMGGQYRATGNIQEPFLLVLNNSGSRDGSYTWSFTTSTVPSLPELTLILVVALALVVGVSGGIAMFLGLFLRSGVYDGPRSMVSQSADDVEEIVRGETDPDDDLDGP